MTGVWLASYVLLWVLVVGIGLFLIGMLRQIGILQLQLVRQPAVPLSDVAADAPVPELIENDGPAIGSAVPDLVAETITGFGTVNLAAHGKQDGLLLMFMTPMCETCQHIVEPLNALPGHGLGHVQPVILLGGDEHACLSFISVFPLRHPTICDRDRMLTRKNGIHRIPFGLLYDYTGTLVRKGVVQGPEDLRALLGDASASPTAQANVYPRPVTSTIPALSTDMTFSPKR